MPRRRRRLGDAAQPIERVVGLAGGAVQSIDGAGQVAVGVVEVLGDGTVLREGSAADRERAQQKTVKKMGAACGSGSWLFSSSLPFLHCYCTDPVTCWTLIKRIDHSGDVAHQHSTRILRLLSNAIAHRIQRVVNPVAFVIVDRR